MADADAATTLALSDGRVQLTIENRDLGAAVIDIFRIENGAQNIACPQATIHQVSTNRQAPGAGEVESLLDLMCDRRQMSKPGGGAGPFYRVNRSKNAVDQLAVCRVGLQT